MYNIIDRILILYTTMLYKELCMPISLYYENRKRESTNVALYTDRNFRQEVIFIVFKSILN